MVSSDLDKTYFDMKGGLEFLGDDTYTMSLQGFGRFSENTTGYGGSGKFAVKF